MREYRADPSSSELSQELKTALVFVIAATIIIVLKLDDWGSDQLNIILGLSAAAILGGLICFWKLEGQSRYEKYRLSIDDERILWEEKGKNPVEIKIRDVVRIRKRSNGKIYIDGQNEHQFIVLPAKMLDGKVLEEDLNRIAPIAEYTQETFFERLRLSYVVLVIATLLRFVSPMAGLIAALLGVLVITIVGMHVLKRKDLDQRTRSTIFGEFYVILWLALFAWNCWSKI